MSQPECTCAEPTKNCPRYGRMLGRRWQVCQGINITPEKREGLLALYKGEEPPLSTKLGNYIKAVSKHIVDGMVKLDKQESEARLEVCASCDRLGENRTCLVCGCPVDEKAKWRSEDCPLEKWPKITLPAAPADCGCK